MALAVSPKTSPVAPFGVLTTESVPPRVVPPVGSVPAEPVESVLVGSVLSTGIVESEPVGLVEDPNKGVSLVIAYAGIEMAVYSGDV